MCIPQKSFTRRRCIGVLGTETIKITRRCHYARTKEAVHTPSPNDRLPLRSVTSFCDPSSLIHIYCLDLTER